jgi:hypothetical protein
MILIDFEGYKIEDYFIIKELSYFDFDTLSSNNYFVKSPKIKKTWQTYWVYKNIHLIPLTFGNTSFYFIKEILNKHQIILVKGQDKKSFIQKLIKLARVINIESLGCPKFKEDINSSCYFNFHNTLKFRHCAFKKLTYFKDWIYNETRTRQLGIPENFIKMQNEHEKGYYNECR